MREPNSPKAAQLQQERTAAICVRHLGVFVAFCAVAVLWLLLFRMGDGARPSTGIATSRQCSSTGCEETARELGRYRSPDTNPCVDFYEHVCGGFSRSKEASGVDSGVLRRTVIRLLTSVLAYNLAKPAPRLKQSASQKASTFLRACRARTSRYEDNLSALKRFTGESGLFSRNESFHPLSDIGKRVFILGFPLFFQVSVDDSYIWRGNFPLCLQLSPTRLWLKAQNAFRDKDHHKRYVFQVLRAAAVSSYAADGLASDIVDLEYAVGSAYDRYLNDSKRTAEMMVVRLEQFVNLLTNDTESIDKWSSLISKTVSASNASMPYLLVEKAAVAFLSTLLNDVDKEKLRTLIAWESIREVVAAAGVVPIPGDYTQWYCIERALRIYGHSLTLPYILSATSPAALEEAGRVYANVKNQLRRMANGSKWLRGSALSTGMKAIEQLTARLVFPPALESLGALNELYQDTPNVNCPFLLTYLAGSRAYASRVIYLASTSSTPYEYSDPRNFLAVALYKRQVKSIFISAASAFPPNLDAVGPRELNYAFFGRVVAQAISLFLKQYLQHADAPFSGKRLRTPAAPAAPANVVVKCLKDQALALQSAFAGNQRGHQTGPSAQHLRHRVLNSIFLDSLCLAAVHGAYTTSAMSESLERAPASLPGLEDVAGERLLFYAWCHSLCGGRNAAGAAGGNDQALSCNLPLVNHAAFARAFSCSLGAPMNPERKCLDW